MKAFAIRRGRICSAFPRKRPLMGGVHRGRFSCITFIGGGLSKVKVIILISIKIKTTSTQECIKSFFIYLVKNIYLFSYKNIILKKKMKGSS